MCGIVGYTGGFQAAPILLKGLTGLEYRGYDSAGIAVMNDNRIGVSKVLGGIEALKQKTENGRNISGAAGIGHTRWATHGAPTEVNAHPHLSQNGKFAVVHNGIIENYIKLRDELLSKGYTFKTETDTEVVAYLIEAYYEGDINSAIRSAVSRLKGSYALGIIACDRPQSIYAVKESSPLIIGIGSGENYFASDVTALLERTKNVIYLNDGEFAEITPESITVFDFSGKEKEKCVQHIDWDITASKKGEYEHFMLKEIMEQPDAVNKTISKYIKNNEIVFGADFKNINKVVITACGSAYYAGIAGKYAIEELCKMPVSVELASELRYGYSIIDQSTLLIALSQSGETADTLEALKICKKKGAKTLAIVNVLGSTIAKEADTVFYTAAGPEIAVATTKGFTTQVAVLYLIGLYLAKRFKRIEYEKYLKYINSLKLLPEKIKESIAMNDNISKTAQGYCSNESVFFIGRSTDYAAALEGALKMKEISYIHAEAYAAGELKHGTIALIDKGTPVIALCCNESILEKTMNNIMEVKARGAKVLTVTNRDNKKIRELSNDIIFVPRVEDIFLAIVEIIPLQLLSYHVAKSRGCDIDKPKNLAKSVTVE